MEPNIGANVVPLHGEIEFFVAGKRTVPSVSESSQSRKRGQGYTAQELLQLDLPEPEWIVPGLLSEGAGLLVGRPKLGKSYMALGLGLAVAQGTSALGTIPVDGGEVLCLALEDGSRRLQVRLRYLLQGAHGPANLHIYPMRSWPRLADGGLDEIDAWLAEHPAARLVTVDTLQRFRGARTDKRDLYAEDYEVLASLQEVAERHHVAVLALHHQRKQEAEDPLETVMGTTGVTGAVDSAWILERQRGSQDAKLTVIGRDLEDQELALRFDPASMSWTMLGDAARYGMSEERQEILAVVTQAGRPVTTKETAEALGKKETSVRSLMWRMSQAGQLAVTAPGLYSVPVSVGSPCSTCGGSDPDCVTCGYTWLALLRRGGRVS